MPHEVIMPALGMAQDTGLIVSWLKGAGDAVKAGDAIALSEKAQKQLRVKESLTVAEQMGLSPSWVEVDAAKFAGVFKAVPDRGDLPADINEALIVELYSK